MGTTEWGESERRTLRCEMISGNLKPSSCNKIDDLSVFRCLLRFLDFVFSIEVSCILLL